MLKGGKKSWALACTGQSTTPKGHDQGEGYLLLATACDGTLATTAQFASVRVVCNNTVHIALGDNTGAVLVSHRSSFDADAVKRQLGIAASSWDSFMVRMRALPERKVSDAQDEAFLAKVLTLLQHSQFMAPLPCVIAAAASLAGGRHRRKLFQRVASSQDADAVDQLTWQDFERLVAEALQRDG